MSSWKNAFDHLWRASRPLTAFGASMVVLTPVLGAMVLIDPTEVEHHIRWIKPMKFTISFAVYAFSIAWVMKYVAAGRLRNALAWILSGTAVLEISVIALQAMRGKASHFNSETMLDLALFNVMGAGIIVFFAANMVAVVLALRAQIADRILSAGLKLGFAIASVGMFEAVLMLGPTAEQAAELEAGKLPARIGTHNVGATEDGASLPFVGWSTEHGDLRPAHFFGMHALQVLPLAALLIRRRRRWSEEQKVRLVWTASAAHLALIALLTWQALRGQPLLAPDALTMGALVTVGFATLLATFLIDQQPLNDSLAEVVR